jgi:cytochrome b subunit of formate dehydrogenase/nitrate/TMAO reductase-like tetraheme cytochrome c subunit
LFESGLLVTATCTDCHTAHHVLPRDNPLSSVNGDNLPKTCGHCHSGVYDKFRNSIHSPTVSKTDKKLPTCKDCHQAHTISRTDKEAFRQNILDQCGNCHQDVAESYFQTYHGKVSKLGYGKVAKCNDCHGAHNILPPTDIHSTLSRNNIVATCGKCHPESNRKFAGYLTHATHHERHKYPILFFTYWFMVILLTGTFTFAGIHTLLWLPRSYLQRRKTAKHPPAAAASSDIRQYMRFSSLPRQLHVLVIISFLGLAITGMTLKFSYLPWAQWLSRMLGGFESAGFIHRVGAVITFIYFGAHVIDLFKRKQLQKKTWIQFLLDANSMLPNRTDLREVIGTLKWFIGRGPRPAYGRWTYWEKFDYFAVFWGVTIIGSSGMVLWFPEFFTLFLPGWLINVATIVHSDEALLAVGFIFTM